MKKIFLDSSVLVAASASLSGASAYILGLCRKKKLIGLVSLAVIGEARKNVNLKIRKEGKIRLISFLKLANLKLIATPEAKEITFYENIINSKDALILAAVVKSSAKYLITLDKKHFLKLEVKNFIKPKKIFTPGEFVKRYIRQR